MNSLVVYLIKKPEDFRLPLTYFSYCIIQTCVLLFVSKDVSVLDSLRSILLKKMVKDFRLLCSNTHCSLRIAVKLDARRLGFTGLSD